MTSIRNPLPLTHSVVDTKNTILARVPLWELVMLRRLKLRRSEVVAQRKCSRSRTRTP